MRLGLLIFMALIPAAVAGQQKNPDLANNEARSIPSAQAVTSLTENENSFTLSSDITSEIDPTTTQAPNPSPAGNVKQSASTGQNGGIERRPTSGSMVGYVDSAIVGSELRLRFDDAFHNSAPDRAEFFYAQCGCTNLNPRAPGPDFPGASTNINFQQVYVMAEYSPIRYFSFFTEVPFRWIEAQPPLSNFISGSFTPPGDKPSFATNSGISDVRAGMKLSLSASSRHSLTLQVKAYFPSGNAFLGLGTAHYSIEPSILYYQQLSQRWAIESQLGDWHPIGGSKGELTGTTTSTNFAGDVLIYGVGPSFLLINGDHIKIAPVVELYGWHVFDGLQTQINPFPSNSICTTGNIGDPGCSTSAGGTNIVNLKVGVRTSFGSHNSVYVGFGQAVTHWVWYEHIVRAEYRYSF